jgi:dihydrofolate reductase
MRVVATEYVSLDGVFEAPGEWSGPYFDDEVNQFKLEELQASDALLVGRKTYAEFFDAWPTVTDDTGFAEKMNSMPKYVVSSTLTTLEWSGAELVKGNLAKEVRKLAEQPGQDLLLSGSAQLFNALKDENLIDVYRMLVHPIALGKGRRLFADGTDQRALKLTDTKTFGSGVMALEYTPADRS